MKITTHSKARTKAHTKAHQSAVVFAICAYPPFVLASEAIAGPLNIPLIQYGYVLVMASWGAGAAILQRYAKGEAADNWGRIIARDFVNATLAAVLAFFICEQFKVPPPLQAVAYTLAGYGGAHFMDVLYGKFVKQVQTLGQKGGGTSVAISPLVATAPPQPEPPQPQEPNAAENPAPQANPNL